MLLQGLIQHPHEASILGLHLAGRVALTDNTSGTTITVTEAFSSQPLNGAVYSISTNSVQEQKFRCLSVTDNNDGTFAVVAVQFNDSIYKAADKDRDIEFDDITTVDERPPIPVI